MRLSASAFLLALSSLAALEPVTAFPIAGPGPANQVQFSRFNLKGKTMPGCYYTCPALTDEVPDDTGIDADDSQGEMGGDDKFTTCRYASYWDSQPIACVYDNESGRLLSSRIGSADPSAAAVGGSAAAVGGEPYAACSPFASARNDRGRGTCMRSAATKKQEALEEAGKARLKAAQWTREKQQKRAEVIAARNQ